ncbi:MAG: IclR family transcriptional regulator [Rhodospirillales bacterium]|nr:IclR family transcriptional regulator [Rhodospirillales bacterium]
MYRYPEQRAGARRTISGPRPARSGSQSLERGLDILETIEAENGDIGVRELARRLELSPTIVQRLVSSLAVRGYIEKNAETSRYRLGHRSMILGASGERGVDYLVTARRELDRLAQEHHLNGFVSVLRSGRAIYLLAVQADGLAIRVSIGSEMPLHSTAAGKVLLASLDDGEARKLLGHRKLLAITPHTVTDPAVLVASLAKVRRQGFATVVEENIPGVLSVGAPITDRAGSIVAALSVAFPKYLESGLTLQGSIPLVTAAALRISRTLGAGEVGTSSAPRSTAIGERNGGKK